MKNISWHEEEGGKKRRNQENTEGQVGRRILRMLSQGSIAADHWLQSNGWMGRRWVGSLTGGVGFPRKCLGPGRPMFWSFICATNIHRVPVKVPETQKLY